MDNKNIPIIVFLDTGLQKTFIPLLRLDNNTLGKNVTPPPSLKKALDEIEERKDIIPENAKETIKKLCQDGKSDWESPYSYIKGRFGKKTWYINKTGITLGGVWIIVETNTSAQDSNLHQTKYDRGYFYQSNGLSAEEKNEAVEAFKKHIAFSGGTSHYIDLRQNETLQFSIQSGNDEINFGGLTFELVIRTPGGEIRDVDVILDLGNTRTAGLLFDHAGNSTFSPNDFKQLFKVLRLKPDPASGEYDSINDVEAGITPSWIVLHELEHQKYLTKNEKKEPELLQTELRGVSVVPKTSGLIFKKTDYEVTGDVCQRIPQMFMQLSPVLLGDQAERSFNSPYAKNMISVGARLQQSSPKRYYWDNSKGDVWWNMLLNEWDKHYNDNPEDASFLPTIQGEMLRFINDDGSILDLSKDREPADQPVAYPDKPAYPRQSTLTWFLLHILERAYSQTNSAFAEGQNFIPHRLRKVLITYPSGWTNDEVARYRERCQEALNIFSQTNIYHGIKSEFKLEMIPQEQTPDEAVAGQLPFVFSEIIRYKGQSAAKWISLVGKKRQGTDTVRIMNFDIGGGTTDISVIEYQDMNSGVGVSQNMISTSLLFKDGQAIAGDDLIKKIIEQIVLKCLIRIGKRVPNVAESIIKCFTQAFTEKRADAVRCRVVRTCLIPMATMCLSSSGEGTVTFSAQDAGVNENNWNEFLEFINVPQGAIPHNHPCISFSKSDLNPLIEEQFSELFKNCAMYAAAYDIDMLIFSGKPSEIPYIQTMAKKYIPIDDERIIFARDFMPGHWYPFTDDKGYIKDAKTVTVVGSALYYALSNGLIAGWTIKAQKNAAERNEWGEIEAMKDVQHQVFLPKDLDSVSVNILPNMIIARRQNKCSSPEPVYKFVQKNKDIIMNKAMMVTFTRTTNNDGESISLESVKDSSGQDVTKDYDLILWPCENGDGINFWQEKGIFSNLEE